ADSVSRGVGKEKYQGRLSIRYRFSVLVLKRQRDQIVDVAARLLGGQRIRGDVITQARRDDLGQHVHLDLARQCEIALDLRAFIAQRSALLQAAGHLVERVG